MSYDFGQHKRIIPARDAEAIRRMRARGYLLKEIAALYAVSTSTVWKIAKGLRYA